MHAVNFQSYASVDLENDLELNGYAIVPNLLDRKQCLSLRSMYGEPKNYRATISMHRHGFGQGEYKYFAYPLPELIKSLRSEFYKRLVSAARDWADKLNVNQEYPDSLEDFLAICKDNGQTKATSLTLKYVAGDFNRLHQDQYGKVSFPWQLAICLSRPNEEFVGGEFVLAEYSPRMQTRIEVVPLNQGDGVVFPNQVRAVSGTRGFKKVRVRHGVSIVRRGTRFCMGIIFHDAT